MSRPAALGLRLYRALARAFPYEFRNAWGDELLLTAEDAIEDVWRRHGVLGLLRLLVDIARRIPIEHLSEVWRDVRYGLRSLAAAPGFTLVAVFSLSLGICAPTALFSELNATIWRDIPAVADPDALVVLPSPISYPAYRRYAARSELFSSTLAYVAPVPFGLASGGGRRVWGHLVTPSYFSTLGVRPWLGRFFEGQEGGAPSAVVGYRFWVDHLGSDPSVVGKTVRLNGHPCTILGVAPKAFLGASPLLFHADVWMPLSTDPRVAPELAYQPLEQRNLLLFRMVARLRPGVTPLRAEAQMDAVRQQMEADYGEAGKNQRGRGVRLWQGGTLIGTRQQDARLLLALPFVLMTLILLLACSNVANMLLARASQRRREVAIRLAMGAGRARLVRQLLTESMLVAGAAGVLGYLLTLWLMWLSSRMKLPHAIPVDFNVMPDGRVLFFAIGLTLLAGLAFGLVPALQSTHPDLVPALKEGGAARFRRFGRLSLRNWLVLGQVAASLTLLLPTAAIAIGFRAATGVDVGFDSRNLHMISVDPVRDGYSGAQTAAFLPKLLDRVKGLPAVHSACLTEALPLVASGRVGFSSGRVLGGASKYVVGRDYFETLGIPVLLGRGFRLEDETEGAPAVIVNERLVEEYWRGADPLGRRIEVTSGGASRFDLFGGSSLDYSSAAPRVLEVVGVVRNVKMETAMERARPAIYLPLRPSDFAAPTLQGVTLMVRAAPGVDAAGVLRREIAAMNSAVTPFNPRTMAEHLDLMMFSVRVGVWSYATMGLFGVILASAGVAGVTAYAVVQRRHELGIRLALGARRIDVLALVMKESAALIAGGAAVGLAGAWGFGRLFSAALEPVARVAGRATSEPALVLGAPLFLACLALAACYLPARKSTRIDPVVALREE